MTGSGKGTKRKSTEKQEKREFPDGEINVPAIMPGAQRTRKDGGARVPVCSICLLASIIVLLTLVATRMDLWLRKEVSRFFIFSYSRQGSLFVLVPGRVLCNIL